MRMRCACACACAHACRPSPLLAFPLPGTCARGDTLHWRSQVRELAVLGFLSFSSAVFLQFVVLPEEVVQLFEYAQ